MFEDHEKCGQIFCLFSDDRPLIYYRNNREITKKYNHKRIIIYYHFNLYRKKQN